MGFISYVFMIYFIYAMSQILIRKSKHEARNIEISYMKSFIPKIKAQIIFMNDNAYDLRTIWEFEEQKNDQVMNYEESEINYQKLVNLIEKAKLNKEFNIHKKKEQDDVRKDETNSR